MKRLVSVFLTMSLLLQMLAMLGGFAIMTEAAEGAVLIDSFDDYGRLETIDKKEGAGAAVELISGGSGTAGVFCGISRTYEPAKDLSAYITSDAYIHIWLYIQNSDYFMAAPKDSFLELSSSGNGWTAGAVRYDLSGVNVVDGWNELFLPLSGFHSVDGSTPCDWTAVNFFRLYTHNRKADGSTFDQIIMVDELSIGRASDFPGFPKNSQIMIENFDYANQYYAVSSTDAKEGRAAAEVTAGGLTILERVYSRPKNLSAYMGKANAYIHLWLYIQDVEYVHNADGRLEISSGGFWGSQVAKYDVKKMHLKSGWNELYLPLSGFEVLDPNIGTCDWSRVNYIRLYLQNTHHSGTAVSQTMRMDGLEIGLYNVPAQSTLMQIESYDSSLNFLGAVATDTSVKTEGTASAVVTTTVTGGGILTAIETRYTYARDLSFYKDREDAYIHLSLYLENADFFDNRTFARVELSSGTGWGAQVDRYDLSTVKLKDGWNELYLPVTGFTPEGNGTCDWSNINYTRVYLFNNIAVSGQTMCLDDLSIGLASDFDIPAASTKQMLESYDNATKFKVDTNVKQEGKGAAKAEVTIDGNANYPTIFEAYYSQTKDLSAYKNDPEAYLHLWVYMENAAWFRNDVDARLELSSGGNYAANTVYYDLTQETFVDGWNELLIPISQLQSMNNGTCDFAHINYIRIFMHHIRFGGATGKQTVYLDALEIGKETDFNQPEDAGTLLKLEGYDNPNLFAVDTTEKKEGNASAVSTATGTNPLTQVDIIYSQRKDLSFYKQASDAYVQLQLYVEDAGLLNQNQDMFLEIGSGGWYGAGIARYDLAEITLQNGWNELLLPVSDFQNHSDSNVTACDWSGVNYIRLYAFSAAASGKPVTQIIRLDGMYIGLKDDFEFAVPEESTRRLIESFDSANKFIVDTQDKKQGSASAVSDVTAAGEALNMVEAGYRKAMDLSEYTDKDAYIHLWVYAYAEDISRVDSQIESYLEIGSGGNWDKNVSRYDLTKLDFTLGWNELLIPVSDFLPHTDPAVGGCDWRAVNYIRIYFLGAAVDGGKLHHVMKVDGMEIGLKSDFADADPIGLRDDGAKKRTIEPFDNVRYFTVDTEDKKEGYGAAVSDVSEIGEVLNSLDRSYSKSMDLSAFVGNDKAYLHLWIYVDDASLLDDQRDGYLEIGSGGGWDKNISRYDIVGLAFEDGWNELLIPVNEMEAHSDPAVGGCDWSAVNYIRLYMFSTSMSGGQLRQIIKADGLEIGLAADFADAKPIGSRYVGTELRMIEPFDDTRYFSVDTVNKKEGRGSAMIQDSAKNEIATVVDRGYVKPMDLSAFRNTSKAYIHLWVYVKNASAIDPMKDGYIEIGSAGTWNKNISRYDISGLAFRDGWNELLIPVKAFAAHSDTAVGGCDWSAVNYVRIYLHSTAMGGGTIRQTMRTDSLQIGLIEEFADANPIGPRYRGTQLRVLEPFEDAKYFKVDTVNKKQGAASAKVTVSGKGKLLTAVDRVYTKTTDLSAFDREDAYFRFWLYVEDASLVDTSVDAFFEVGSGGGWDRNVSRYPLTGLELRDGWNEVYVPLSKMQAHPDPNVGCCDWSRMNYIRIYLHHSDPYAATCKQTMAVDALTIGLAADMDVPVVKKTALVESYDDAHRFTVNNENFKEGTGAAMVTTEAAGNILTAIESFYNHTLDLSEYARLEDGCIAFWLYIDNVDYLSREQDGYVEFSSGGFWGSEVARHDLIGRDLQQGWNRIVLPIRSLQGLPGANAAPCDWSRINYIRVYLHHNVPGASAPQIVMVDEMRVGCLSDFTADAVGEDVKIPVAAGAVVSLEKGQVEGQKINVNIWIWIIVPVVLLVLLTLILVLHKKRKKRTA